MSTLLQVGYEHHQAGRLVEAERSYRKFLRRDRRNPDCWHLLGVLCYQSERYAEALDLISRAIRINAAQPLYHCHLGSVFHAQGKHEKALLHYTKALDLDPGSLETLERLGLLYCQTMRFDEAQLYYERALALHPKNVFLWSGFGDVLRLQGRLDEAIGIYLNALRLDPYHPPALINLAASLETQGRLDMAASLYERAQALAPRMPEPYYNRGNIYMAQGQLLEAQEQFGQAIKLQPLYADAHNNLGTVFYLRNQTDDAMASYKQAIASRRGFADAHANLGNTLRSKGLLEEAVIQYREALSVDPALPEAHLNLGMIDLLHGRYQEGWKGYEWRRRVKSNITPPVISHPLWDLSSPRGKRILLHSEQGLGDTLQFLRFVPMLHQAGAEVVLQIPERLKRLASGLDGVVGIVGPNEPLPEFSCHYPLMSLPFAFGTTLDNLPSDVPYLVVPGEASQKASLLDWATPLLRVGLAWAGSVRDERDRVRSIPFFDLEPLLAQQGVQFYSLQLEALNTDQRSTAGRLIDLSAPVTDMADTAAHIQRLDLVITVDTSIAHLAGALGKPTWIMLPASPDWRWLLERQDSPWYPSVRLFRQTNSQGWSEVISRITSTLAEVEAGTLPKTFVCG